MLILAVHLTISAGFVLLGWWGRKQATSLVWAGLPQRDRRHRIGVVRRGGAACYAVAVVVALIGLAAVTA